MGSVGGKCGKHSLLQEDDGYKPTNFFRLSDDKGWLCGGCIPIFHESLAYLKAENIGLIITLTIDSIRIGRNINHVPYDFEHTLWADSDDINLSEFKVVHIPVTDAYPFYGENSTLFLTTLREYHIANPGKSVYITGWSKNRSGFACIYALMKFWKLDFHNAYTEVREHIEGFQLSDFQKKYLNNKELTELDIYNSKPIVRTPQDHECFQMEEEEKNSTDKQYQVATPKLIYQHNKCVVCTDQCSNITGNVFIEPIFRTIPETESKPCIELEIEKKADYLPRLTDEIMTLFELHKRYTISDAPKNIGSYNFVTHFRLEEAPDMVAFIKRIDNYIFIFDRKGCGAILSMNVGSLGVVNRFGFISMREGCPVNVFLYHDISDNPIIVAHRYSDYGIWKMNDLFSWSRSRCYNDYKSKLGWGFKFILATNGRMVYKPKEGELKYASFKVGKHGCKLILEDIPKSDYPLYEKTAELILPDSDDRFHVGKKLLVSSIPEKYLEKIASKPSTYDSETKKFVKCSDYHLLSIYSGHLYDDIAIIGHDYGNITVWKH